MLLALISYLKFGESRVSPHTTTRVFALSHWNAARTYRTMFVSSLHTEPTCRRQKNTHNETMPMSKRARNKISNEKNKNLHIHWQNEKQKKKMSNEVATYYHIRQRVRRRVEYKESFISDSSFLFSNTRTQLTHHSLAIKWEWMWKKHAGILPLCIKKNTTNFPPSIFL